MTNNFLTAETLQKLSQKLAIGDFIHGLRLVESVEMVVQFRFQRSKKRRIRKKWAKRKRNFKPRQECFLLVSKGIVIVHPVIAAKIRGIIDQAGCRRETFIARDGSTGAVGAAFSF